MRILRRTLLLALVEVAAAAEPVRPLVIAHRGASGYLPEHTQAAKALAVGMGADYLEQDLVLSRDDVPVLLHDIHLESVTDVAKRLPERARPDGRFYAIDFTVAELKQLTVTERMDIKRNTQAMPARFPAGQGSFGLVTLEEELQFVRGLEKSLGRAIGIYPELKRPGWHRKEGRDLAAAVLPLLARHGFDRRDSRCFLQCFEFDELVRLRGERGYQGRLIFLCGGAPTNLAAVAAVADGIGPGLGAVVTGGKDREPQPTTLVGEAHAAGLLVHPYTVRADDLPSWAGSFDEVLEQVLVRAGADGVFTDFPDRAVEFVRRRFPR